MKGTRDLDMIQQKNWVTVLKNCKFVYRILHKRMTR